MSLTRLNLLAPDTTTEGNVQVPVTNSKGTSDPVTVAFMRLMPGFFQFPGDNVVAVRADGLLIGPSRLIDGVTTVPAKPGETIQLFGTGFGVTTPLQTSTPVTVRIDSQDAVVTYAGLTSAGLCQINVTVPANLGDGDYPVTPEVAGVRTAKIANLAISKTAAAGSSVSRPRLNRTDRQSFLALVRRIRNEG